MPAGRQRQSRTEDPEGPLAEKRPGSRQVCARPAVGVVKEPGAAAPPAPPPAAGNCADTAESPQLRAGRAWDLRAPRSRPRPPGVQARRRSKCPGLCHGCQARELTPVRAWSARREGAEGQHQRILSRLHHCGRGARAAASARPCHPRARSRGAPLAPQAPPGARQRAHGRGCTCHRRMCAVRFNPGNSAGGPSERAEGRGRRGAARSGSGSGSGVCGQSPRPPPPRTGGDRGPRPCPVSGLWVQPGQDPQKCREGSGPPTAPGSLAWWCPAWRLRAR